MKRPFNYYEGSLVGKWKLESIKTNSRLITTTSGCFDEESNTTYIDIEFLQDGNANEWFRCDTVNVSSRVKYTYDNHILNYNTSTSTPVKYNVIDMGNNTIKLDYVTDADGVEYLTYKKQ